MIDTLLFDFDGTLMDTNDVIIASWQETFRQLTGGEADEAMLYATFGEPLEGTMRRFFPDVPLEKSLQIYRGYQAQHYLEEIHLFPGIRALLDELATRPVQMALVTSRLRHTTRQALEAFDLEKYFACVITADDVTRHKPDPQCIQAALDHLGAAPQQALMVGDTVHDIQCARNAGVRSVLVSWTAALARNLEEGLPEDQTPDAIIEQPSELLGLVGRIALP